MRPKGVLWREARVKNLQKQIRLARKKIHFWTKLRAQANSKEAMHKMISLKSKLADIRRSR